MIHHGDALTILRTLPDGSVHCCVTSPPYYGLRDYGVKGQIGLEATPAEFIARLVDVFREVRRVLRPDGTCWVNIGDSYCGYHGNKNSEMPTSATNGWVNGTNENTRPKTVGINSLKPKDLIGIPWMLAFALRKPYHVGPIKREIDRAWLAAMLDSDGCLGIRTQAPREGRGENETFAAYLSVSQSDTAALDHCVEITGIGSVRVKHVPREDSRGIRSRRTMYTWRIEGPQAADVIRDVYPHLLIKKQQAQLVYAMTDSLKWGRPTRSLPVPEMVMERRRQLHSLVRSLNQRESVTLPGDLPDVPPPTEPGWWLRQDIIWHKPNPMPESVRDRCTKAHEYVFLLTKSARYWWDADAIREPHSEVSIARAKRNRFGGKFSGTDRTEHSPLKMGEGYGPNGDVDRVCSPGGRNKRSVWTLATLPTPDAHFATYPVELAETCILAGCPAGGTVLDPFAGAGTTGLAALKHGRQFIGIELNAEYIKIAETRLNRHMPILGVPA